MLVMHGGADVIKTRYGEGHSITRATSTDVARAAGAGGRREPPFEKRIHE